MSDILLFSGGLKDRVGTDQWATRFGIFNGNQADIFPVSGEIIESDSIDIFQRIRRIFDPIQHLEAQHIGIIGTDFIYSAEVTISSTVDVHLQFRVSDEGRYGLLLRPDGFVFYCFRRENKACHTSNPSIIAHCPNWSKEGYKDSDNPQWFPLLEHAFSFEPGSAHTIGVNAKGSNFTIFVDNWSHIVDDASFNVGRFGIYVIGDADSIQTVSFTDVRATTDPTNLSNLALLYSTLGYEAQGTKRALVRTLNDIPPELFDVEHSQFTVTQNDGIVVKKSKLCPMRAINDDSPNIAKTFGMQLWEADFSCVTEEGFYTLSVDFSTANGVRRLKSPEFEIRSHLVTARILKPLSFLNALARRAADDDFWRNWIIRSGIWNVALDGAFLADRANNEEGALLERVFNNNNSLLEKLEYLKDFRFVGRITIISGCDAQMQFRISPTERWAVTLQAGDAGNCAFGRGPGAIRLHREWQGGGFEIIAAQYFTSDLPFIAGRPYYVEIIVNGRYVTVSVDGVPQLINVKIENFNDVPAQSGRFALKAWASTVRFESVQVWNLGAQLFLSPEGVQIPIYTDKFSWDVVPDDPFSEPFKSLCNPEFSMSTGFHDCNNIIGEATSHGALLSGLMEVWNRRANTFSQQDREALRHSIITAVLYIEKLYQQKNASGEFTHAEMGGAAIYTNLGPWHSQVALYGLSAFADKGTIIDKTLARLASKRLLQGAEWLQVNGMLNDPVLASVIYARLARCAEREQLGSEAYRKSFWPVAIDSAKSVLAKFVSRKNGIGGESRDTGRVIPWFEGVYEVLQSHPEMKLTFSPSLESIANNLLRHLTSEHQCDSRRPGARICPPNGFFVLPEASGDAHVSWMNWIHMDTVPLVDRPPDKKVPFINAYGANHYAVAATDAALIGIMSGSEKMELLASSNLYWTLGINPGIPSSKVVNVSKADTPWQAASFIYNLSKAFARTFQGFRTNTSSAKGWVSSWEEEVIAPSEGTASSPHREVWWIDPQNRSYSPPLRDFQTIVNGHVIWDRQWDYWNTGESGWLSGETFILSDGTFLKAALLYEDWLSLTNPFPLNPYDLTKVGFFDTTHVERKGTGWGFDDPDRTSSALASRAANEFSVGKGYHGGRFTGHYNGERIGIICIPTTARFFDATNEEIQMTSWYFNDITKEHWAQVARAATEFANSRNFIGGFFTGHQLNGRHGIVCLNSDVAHWFDATDEELFNSGEGFGDINTVLWAKAARAATNICLARGFKGGFFTGYQRPGKIGVVGFVSGS